MGMTYENNGPMVLREIASWAVSAVRKQRFEKSPVRLCVQFSEEPVPVHRVDIFKIDF